VKHAGHDDGWAVLGGVVEVGETPWQTAVREAREEIGVEIRLTGLLDVLGGPDFQVTYPHGDRCAYVTSVFAAEITDGLPAPDKVEVTELRWFDRAELAGAGLNQFARALLTATGHLE
jgi:ADP-ribose pyrophosphatase YjhB (NUDIX family)